MNPLARQKIPQWEVNIYTSFWSLMLVYVFYQVYLETKATPLSDYHSGFVIPGWEILGGFQDVSDFEWHFWRRLWGSRVLPWLIAHAVFSILVHMFFDIEYELRGLVHLTFSMCSLTCLLGWKSLLFLLARAGYTNLIAKFGSTRAVWLNCLFLLTTLNVDFFTEQMKRFHDESVSADVVSLPRYNLLMMVTALYDTRMVSFSLERCWRRRAAEDANTFTHHKSYAHQSRDRHKSRGDPGFYDMLVYLFYLPLFYTGPLVTFDKFYIDIIQPARAFSMDEFWSAMKELGRLLFWLVVVEVALHYLHFNAIELSTTRLYSMNLWSLGGCGYLQVHFFLLKYLLIYGIASLFARADRVGTPDGPKCIALMYTVSQVWRTFDRGYYSFMKRYIYEPLGGSRQGLCKQIIGVIMTFIFVYMWHGTDRHMFVWTMYNILIILTEVLTTRLCLSSGLQQFAQSNLSTAMQRRLAAVAGIPIALMTIHSMFFFISGNHIGKLFFDKFIIQNARTGHLPMFLCVVYVRNCCALELHKRFLFKSVTEDGDRLEKKKLVK